MDASIPKNAIEVEREEFERIRRSYDAQAMGYLNNILFYYSRVYPKPLLGYQNEETEQFYIDKKFAEENLIAKIFDIEMGL